MSATAADDEQFLKSVRTTLFVTGALALVFGFLVAFHPVGTASVFIALLAFYTLAVGAFDLYLAISGKGTNTGGARWGFGLLGLLYAAAGLWLLVQTFKHTEATAAAFALTIGIIFGVVWLIQGIVTLFAADKSPWVIIFAVISIIAGVSLIATPFFGGVLLWLFLGIWLMVIGATDILRGIFFKSTIKAYHEEIAAEQRAEVGEVVDAVKKAAGTH